jgi:alpha-ketoglutarate-dependent taurine dioxygenase
MRERPKGSLAVTTIEPPGHILGDQYTYQWTEGDVLVWDHIGTLHDAVADYGPDCTVR